MRLLDSCGFWPQMLISLAHCCTCAGRLRALQPGLKAAIKSSTTDTQTYALKRDQQGAPAVVEAVRQRCSHIDATKADQLFEVICAVLKVERTRLQCLPVTSQCVGDFQQVPSLGLAAKFATLTVRWSACRVAGPRANMHVGTIYSLWEYIRGK